MEDFGASHCGNKLLKCFQLFSGIGKKLHGFVERTARACAAAGEIEGSSSSSSHTSILHPVEEFLRALVNPAGM